MEARRHVGPVIDAHHHFWRLSAQAHPWRTAAHQVLAADFEPADLGEELHSSGVDASVLVQSADTADENDRLRAYARSTAFVAGVVGWLPLTDPAAARNELARIRGPWLRGVRCLIGREPLERLEQPDALSVLRGLADEGLAWDVVPVTEAQTRSVIRIAHAVPSLRVVVDHLGRPPLETAGWQPWAGHVRELADCPNVALKVSIGIDVLTAWDAWAANRIAPYVDWAAQCFGPARLMLASNWPVVLLRRGYRQAWADLVESVRLAGIEEHELGEVAGGTATRWYGLGGTTAPATHTATGA